MRGQRPASRSSGWRSGELGADGQGGTGWVTSCPSKEGLSLNPSNPESQ